MFRPVRTLLRGLTMSALAMTLIPPAVAADSRDETIAELKAQLAALNERLERLEARGSVAEEEYGSPAVTPAELSSQWFERIKVSGDFRYRHATRDLENAPDLDVDAIRARVELKSRVSENVLVGAGLSTGSGSPVSGNQALGDGDSYKPVNWDLAYATWDTPVDGVSVTGGKFRSPLHRAGGNGLIWDSDLRPEGGAVTYRQGALFANAMGMWIDANADGNNTLMWGTQAGWSTEIAATSLLFGAGYYDYDTQGDPVPYDGNPRGNSVDANGDYLFDYHEVEAFAELSFDLFERPITLFADYVHNTDADEFDDGYAVGAKAAFDHPRHPWTLNYVWQDLDADAAFALFTDSDFKGGGTDGKGHILKGTYTLTRDIWLSGYVFINKRGGDAGSWQNFDLYMLDISFKY